MTEVRTIAADVKLLSLTAAQPAVLPQAESGAHITLRLPNGMERSYSLLDTDSLPVSYRIAVKRAESGRGGSRFIHDSLAAGSLLDVRWPINTFPLVETACHSVLVAGGIGITPIYSMANRLRTLGRSFDFLYACRSRDEAPFVAEIATWPQARLHFDSEAGGHPDIAALCSAAPRESHLYCCGPAPMLAAFEAATLSWAPTQRHVEHFTPKFSAQLTGSFIVELARSKRAFTVQPGKTILETLREAGVSVAYSCEEGVCGACETRVLSGVPDHRDSILSPAERASGRTMFICCSGSLTDTLVLDL